MEERQGGGCLPALLLLLAFAACAAAAAGLLLELLQARLSDLLEVGVGHGVGVGVGCVCREWSRGCCAGGAAKVVRGCGGREGKCSGVRSLVGQVTYHYLLRVGFDDYHNHDLWEES